MNGLQLHSCLPMRSCLSTKKKPREKSCKLQTYIASSILKYLEHVKEMDRNGKAECSTPCRSESIEDHARTQTKKWHELTDRVKRSRTHKDKMLRSKYFQVAEKQKATGFERDIA